jgi:hypothetical protein
MKDYSDLKLGLLIGFILGVLIGIAGFVSWMLWLG